MVDTRTLARLLTTAQQARAKLVLVGDPAQLPELAAGGLFAGLLARLEPITLTENRRQRHGWDRDALAALRVGDPAPLIRAYQQHDRLTVAGTDTDAGRRLAGDWAAWAAAQPAERLGEGVMLAARQADVDALNRHARHHLHAAGRLPDDTLTVNRRGYAVGDRVVCLRNNRRVGVTNGTRATITHLDPTTATMTVSPTATPRRGRAARLVRQSRAPGARLRGHRAQGARRHRRPRLGLRRPPLGLHRMAVHRAVPPPRHRTAVHLGHHPRPARHRGRSPRPPPPPRGPRGGRRGRRAAREHRARPRAHPRQRPHPRTPTRPRRRRPRPRTPASAAAVPPRRAAAAGAGVARADRAVAVTAPAPASNGGPR